MIWQKRSNLGNGGRGLRRRQWHERLDETSDIAKTLRWIFTQALNDNLLQGEGRRRPLRSQTNRRLGENLGQILARACGRKRRLTRQQSKKHHS